ncbi:MAG: gliding motility protein GldM [Cytophagales bacterium]|nr:gliding motility protein GldM [Cytophagales bacterium]
MSGGKETARQKMIGMMYLVLTALLALNVSSTVIEKFIFLNDSLERANREAEDRNVQILEAMRESVKEKGSKTEDVAVIKDADEVRGKTIDLIRRLEDYKEEFIEETKGYEEGYEFNEPNSKGRKGNRHHIIGKTDYDGVGHYMMAEEEGGQGHGIALKAILGEYTEYIKGVMASNEAPEGVLEHFQSLTPDAIDDPIYSEDPNQEGKKWSQLAFEYSPTHAGLATLSELQASVLGFETRGLDFLKTRTGLTEIVFDEIKAMVNPVAKYVVSGSKYEAEMFIAASASAAKPIMKYNGQDLAVVNGVGKVEFTARHSGGNSGAEKKSFTADITVATAGGDTTFSSVIEYYVVKPAIVISSNTAVSLYRNCANEVRVSVPGLSGNYNPTFGGSGAQFISGTGGELNIVPKSNARKVVLSVSNAGQKIGNKEFSVKGIPAPTIQAKRGNTVVTPAQPIPTGTTALRIEAVADSDFAEGHQADARFVVTSGEASLLSGGIVRKKIPFRNGQLDLRSIASNVRKGDALVIEIKSVARRNFQNQTENFPKFAKFLSINY